MIKLTIIVLLIFKSTTIFNSIPKPSALIASQQYWPLKSVNYNVPEGKNRKFQNKMSRQLYLCRLISQSPEEGFTICTYNNLYTFEFGNGKLPSKHLLVWIVKLFFMGTVICCLQCPCISFQKGRIIKTLRLYIILKLDQQWKKSRENVHK